MSKLPALPILLAALVAASPSSASSPEPATVEAAPSAARRQLALELAKISQPADLLVEAVITGYDQAAAEDADEEMVAINKEFPGFLDKVRLRGRDEIATLMAARAPLLQQKVADVYAADLEEDHLRQLISFLKSPTGQKFIRTMALAPGSSWTADDLTLTETEVAAEARSAAAHSMKQMSGDESIELIKFAVSPAGQANRRIAPKIQKVVATGMTEIMTDFAALMEPITLELLEAYEKPKAE